MKSNNWHNAIARLRAVKLFLLLLILPSFGIAQNQTENDAQSKSEATGNPNLDFAHRLQNQQEAVEKRKTAAIQKSLKITKAGKSSIDKFGAKLTKKCPAGRVTVDNWSGRSGLDITFFGNCDEAFAKVISCLKDLRRELKLKSVEQISFADPNGTYRTFPMVAVTFSSGYAEYSDGTRRAITKTYFTSTLNLDNYLSSKIDLDAFENKVKVVTEEPE